MIYQNLFSEYVRTILAKYKANQPLYLSSLIGFDGTTASQRVTCFTPSIDADALIFSANVNFSNPQVQVKITDTASGYSWNVVQAATGSTVNGSSITALAGSGSQVMPLLPLTCPFFLSKQSKLQMDFVNSATSLTASDATLTWVGIKLFG
jgi:hypothetical protein